MSLFASDDTTTFACLHDVINLECSDGLIFIVSAEYGHYAFECSDECCDPNTGIDCTESMQDYNDRSWNELRLACNYNSQCEFYHASHMMTSCSEQRLADYLSITYVCSNGKTTPQTSRASLMVSARNNIQCFPNYMRKKIMFIPP